MDPIFIPCPCCDGSAEELHFAGMSYDGPDVWAVPCRECDGTGRVEHEAEPITLEDLD